MTCNRGCSLVPTIDHNKWWRVCADCGTFKFLYEPMPHQLRFHQDPAKIRLWAGAYAAAKTTTCGAEMVMLALDTPNGVGLVGAATYPQLEQTAKAQILEMLPKEFIAEVNKKDNVWTLTNGYKFLFRSFDDEQKLRSLNLAHCWVEEANGVEYSIFTQIQTRMRHDSTKDHKIMMSSNPDTNWVRSEILMKSVKIYGATERYIRRPDDINHSMHTHIARTDQNTYLPPTYLADTRAGKPEWWIKRYLEGSFSMSEGAVYPNFQQNVVDISPAEIKHNIRTKGWKVLGGADFGLNDPTILVLAAVDPVEGIAYLYDEYGANRLAVPHHAKVMKERLTHIPFGALMGLYGDPSGKKRNINDRKSIFNHYAEYGIHFEAGDNRIDAGVMKVFGYFEMGKLKILSSCVETIQELTNYHYKSIDLGDTVSEKPADGEDHYVDSLRYLVQTLPDDPDMLKSQTYGKYDFRHENSSEAHLPFELQTNTDETPQDWYNGYY